MKTQELLKINDSDKLKKLGVKKVQVTYRQGILNTLISFFYKKNRATKDFKLDYWITFKDGIIENLYNKGLCKINFL